MYRQCSTEESARRQQQMTQSLLDLMDSMPYARITVADICTGIGLSRKSFYRYFDCKDDCLHALLDQTIHSFAGYYPHAYSTPRPSREFLEHYFSYWQQQKRLLDVLCRNQLTYCLYERTILSVRQEQFLRHATAECEQEYEQMLFMICGTFSLIVDWHLSGYRKTAAQMAASVDQLIRRN